jgi:hypothetical protein
MNLKQNKAIADAVLFMEKYKHLCNSEEEKRKVQETIDILTEKESTFYYRSIPVIAKPCDYNELIFRLKSIMDLLKEMGFSIRFESPTSFEWDVNPLWITADKFDREWFTFGFSRSKKSNKLARTFVTIHPKELRSDWEEILEPFNNEDDYFEKFDIFINMLKNHRTYFLFEN